MQKILTRNHKISYYNKNFSLILFANFVFSSDNMHMEIRRDDYIDRLKSLRNNGRVKIITGIRRCGKSYLLNTLYKNYLIENGVKQDNILIFELDKIRDAKYRNPILLTKTVRGIVENSREYFYLFIDEIQLSREVTNPDDPEGDKLTFYDMLSDLLGIRNLDIYVTGSNSKMLSSDIITNFRDRGDQIRMHPLSFHEFYNYIGGHMDKAYEKYAWFGGMPLVHMFESEEMKMDYLENLFKEIYLKDIVEHYKVKNIPAFEAVLDMLCSSVGSLTNPKRLSDALNSNMRLHTTDVSVKKYLDILEDSFLFRRCRRYDVKGKQYIDTPDKYYAEDIGLRNVRLGFRQQEMPHIMENIVFNDLIRRGFKVDVGVINSRETEDGKQKSISREIDFVVTTRRGKTYIQVAYAMQDEKKRNSEIKPFSMTNDAVKKIIIRGDTLGRWFDKDGIENINIVNFLLDENAIF